MDFENLHQILRSLYDEMMPLFWKVGLVQFFCWAGFLYLWNYSTGAIAETVWNTTDPA